MTERKAASMVKLLVRKDWYLNRWPIAGYLLGAGLSVVTLAAGSEGLFFAGSIVLVTVVVSLGIHLTMSTVVIERMGQTRAFVMSLPVSPRQYTAAKLLAVLSLFFFPWLMIVIATFAVIAGSGSLPDGLIPFAAVALTTLLLNNILIVSVALISESLGWTVGAIVAGNLGFNVLLYHVSHLPAIRENIVRNAIVWPEPVGQLFLAQAAVAVALVALAFWVQSRKRDFR